MRSSPASARAGGLSRQQDSENHSVLLSRADFVIDRCRPSVVERVISRWAISESQTQERLTLCRGGEAILPIVARSDHLLAPPAARLRSSSASSISTGLAADRPLFF
jgi:hypothetical protein